MRDRAVPARPSRGLRGDEAEGASSSPAGRPRCPTRARRARRMAIFDAGVPVLGICYGEQTMAQQLGGKVEGGHHREFGRAEVEVTDDAPLFEGVWEMGEQLPGLDEPRRPRHASCRRAFAVVGTSANAPFAVIADETRQILRHAVPPRSGAHARRRRSCSAISCARSRAAPATGRCAPSATRRSRRSARRSARAG